MPAPTPKIEYRPRKFTITAASNDKIDFEETAATELTATLTAGDYSLAGMAAEVKRALDAAGASTYTVVFNVTGSDINKFTITSDGSGGGGIFNLLWSSGTNTATSAKTTLGFDSVDDTGALTYTSDSQVPVTVSFTFNMDIRSPRPELRPDRDKNTASGGTRENYHRKLEVFYGFRIEFAPRSNTSTWFTFMEDSGLLGGQFDFFPDSAEATFVNFTVDDDKWIPTEMVNRNLFQLYRFNVRFREVLPEESVNTPNGRGSRASGLLNRLQWI